VTGSGLPVLAPGDEIRLDGNSYQVVAMDGTVVRLVDVTGVATAMRIGHLMADASFELVTGNRPRPSGQATIEQLPQQARARAKWWEQHLVEVLTGVSPDAAPDTVPRPEYDPARQSLRQREVAKTRRPDCGRTRRGGSPRWRAVELGGVIRARDGGVACRGRRLRAGS
jgi:putative transposase